MPELPEVETVARGLAPDLNGTAVTGVDISAESSVSGSCEEFVQRITGAVFTRVYRRGKLLLARMEQQGKTYTLAVHLRMSGRLVFEHEIPADCDTLRYLRVALRLANGGRLLFADMRRFGRIGLYTDEELQQWDFYRTLGPEPLLLKPHEFVAIMQDKKAGIKSLLLNQKVIAGVGNIYADESLFCAGIHPMAKGVDIPQEHLEKLHGCLTEILERAIRENGSSIRDYRDAGGNAGAFQNSFQVYGRSGCACFRCNALLDKAKVAGRTTVFCPGCQSRYI